MPVAEETLDFFVFFYRKISAPTLISKLHNSPFPLSLGKRSFDSIEVIGRE